MMNKHRQLEIEKLADKVRNDCNITDYGFHNLFESAEKMGYRVVRYPIGRDSFLGFALIKDTERVIFSNSSQILSREIFTIAHEIGHQKLHLSDQGLTLIKDDDFNDRNEHEIEANIFSACLLMPREKVVNFVRYELYDKSINKFNGLDIARFQTAFNVSYDMVLIRLKALDILNDEIMEKLKQEKLEKTATRLLNAISGNIDLCRPAEVKKVPAAYLEWVISNYIEKLVPLNSLEKALQYVDVKIEDLEGLSGAEEEDKESLDDLLRGMN
jgi:Zn-dependent peptidase ImmA (M78 family)